LESKLEDKTLCTEWQQALPDCSQFLIASWIEFWFANYVPKYFKSSSLPKHKTVSMND
jgi:hypothetical protein